MEKRSSRRDFLRNAISAATAPALVKLENLVQPFQSKVQSAKNELSYLDVYDSKISASLNYFNKRHGRAPEASLVKAMIAEETGSLQCRNTAFKYDPMQIANKGDSALSVLANKKENTYLIGDFSFLQGKRNTPWKKTKKSGYWDYSESNMDAESSIRGGIGWLYHKAAKYDFVLDEEGEEKEYIIQKGDSFSKIAPKLKTNIKSLRIHNPQINPKPLQPGQRIKYAEGVSKLQITGWLPWDKAVANYNGGGNPNYVKEVYDIKRKLDSRE